MRKFVLCLCFILIAALTFAQKKSLVILLKSESSTGIQVNGRTIVKVYKGTFQQDFSLLTSDSAYFYPKENAFDAFGNVVINQGDTLHIYSDLLNYNGNTRIAILTNHCKMVDKDAVLTSNNFTYNTATRIGTYIDGGKLINKDDTLLSKNGYYFARSRDAYFRYNVILHTPDALVLTDTMRYNSGSRISYFYGPTNIYGTKGKKSDRDTLYTENGQYNTKTEQGKFGKNNLYHTGTRSLKGDSLFYDKLKGYGRAVKHVTFEDKEQRTVIKGNLGTYTKADEHTIVTEDPYVVMVVEDSTKTDSTDKADSLRKVDSLHKADSLKKDTSKVKKGAITMNELIKKTIPAKVDTAAARKIANAVNKGVPLSDESLDKLKRIDTAKADSLLKRATGNKTVSSGMALRQIKGATAKNNKKPPPKQEAPAKTLVPDTVKKKKVKTDTIYMSADTIETQVMAYKDLKVYLEQQHDIHMPDTGIYKRKRAKESKFLVGHAVGIPRDTSYLQPNLFGPPKKPRHKPPSKAQLHRDSLEKVRIADSIATAKAAEPLDTARIRILIAYHHFKMFKSDLQGKADSMFYASSDSTIRCFVNPMLWTQGSQLSGDTIYMQLKHKKLDNMTMFYHAFIANIEKTDSVHFNQLSGKRMWGYFANNKLKRIVFSGNAESIYFARDSGKMTISGIQRSLSSRITADFKDNKVTNMGFYTKPENRYGPEKKFTEDDKVLKGFIWKPKDRPVSKESIIPSYNKKKTDAKKKPAGKAAPPDKNKKAPPGKKLPGAKAAVTDSLKLATPKLGKDSTLKADTGKMLKPKTDTVKVRAPVVTAPAGKAGVE